MSQPWYEIRAAKSADAAEIYIFGDIGESWWSDESVTAKKFVEELNGIDAKDITVRINSYGGSVADGLAIYSALRRSKSAITTSVEGVAMSIASLIMMAGESRQMVSNGLLMIHAPWGMVQGNAADMRDMAETLDKYAEAMASAYMRSGLTREQVLALLKDGKDHFYTANEASADGYITEVTGDLDIAAKYRENRFMPAPRPVNSTSQRNQTMSETTQAAANQPAASNPPADIPSIEAAAAAKARAEIAERSREIRMMFAPFAQNGEAFAKLRDEMLDDPSIPMATVSRRLLDDLGKNAEPLAATPRVESGASSVDKFRAGVTAALAHRMGHGKDDRSNEFRGRSLHEIAALSLEVRGVSTRGMTRSEIAGRVLAAHSSSDFPYLLADAANKSLQAAYEAFPSTWQRIAAAGEVSDFKTINLVRMGSFSSLATILEGGEYTGGTISEERSQLTAVTKGRYIECTRKMIVNDDLNAFARMAQMLGRAAGRTVNADVYGVINSNAAMGDGYNLFSSDHSNLAGSSAAITIATLSAARAAMRKQKDPTNVDYLNIQPRVLAVPVAIEDHARTVVTSDFNTDTAAQLKRNIIRDWGPLDVVSDPTLDATSTTAWYLIADPMDVPLLEVRFLDGQQSPYVASEEEFMTDGIRWKVRLDYGVAANDWRAGYKNAGA